MYKKPLASTRRRKKINKTAAIVNPLKASLRRENEDQAKMERASSSSREQQPTIQDSEFKSGPAVEDPFLGFLLDMPFASADDDDDENKQDIINKGKSAEQR